MSCTTEQSNPFLTEWNTPFEQIIEEHFMPAFQQGMKEQQQEIVTIAENPGGPSKIPSLNLKALSEG